MKRSSSVSGSERPHVCPLRDQLIRRAAVRLHPTTSGRPPGRPERTISAVPSAHLACQKQSYIESRASGRAGYVQYRGCPLPRTRWLSRVLRKTVRPCDPFGLQLRSAEIHKRCAHWTTISDPKRTSGELRAFHQNFYRACSDPNGSAGGLRVGCLGALDLGPGRELTRGDSGTAAAKPAQSSSGSGNGPR